LGAVGETEREDESLAREKIIPVLSEGRHYADAVKRISSKEAVFDSEVSESMRNVDGGKWASGRLCIASFRFDLKTYSDDEILEAMARHLADLRGENTTANPERKGKGRATAYHGRLASLAIMRLRWAHPKEEIIPILEREGLSGWRQDAEKSENAAWIENRRDSARDYFRSLFPCLDKADPKRWKTFRECGF